MTNARVPDPKPVQEPEIVKPLHALPDGRDGGEGTQATLAPEPELVEVVPVEPEHALPEGRDGGEGTQAGIARPPVHPSPIDILRAQAAEAIRKGANPAAIEERFNQLSPEAY